MVLGNWSGWAEAGQLLRGSPESCHTPNLARSPWRQSLSLRVHDLLHRFSPLGDLGISLWLLFALFSFLALPKASLPKWFWEHTLSQRTRRPNKHLRLPSSSRTPDTHRTLTRMTSCWLRYVASPPFSFAHVPAQTIQGVDHPQSEGTAVPRESPLPTGCRERSRLSHTHQGRPGAEKATLVSTHVGGAAPRPGSPPKACFPNAFTISE